MVCTPFSLEATDVVADADLGAAGDEPTARPTRSTLPGVARTAQPN
jgi:hypothetical protein